MSDLNEKRAEAATAIRELGHEFVAHEIDHEDLELIVRLVSEARELIVEGDARQRRRGSDGLQAFSASVPEHGSSPPRQLFADSIVSGASNPHGLGAYLFRDGEHAVMEVTLGPAFEGAPGRAHGGIVAALIDETMGMVLSIHGTLALTANLQIEYKSATPVNRPIVARAWLESRDGRKLRMKCVVTTEGEPVAEATSLFIAVDPTKFLDRG